MSHFLSSRLSFGLLSLLIAGLFYLPPIRNHTEAEDAFWYARNVEVYSYSEVARPNHRLYHLVAKATYDLSGQDRSFPVLVAFSAFSSGAALVLFYYLIKKFTVCSPIASLGWVACLAFSYGFWRYGREVEAYALGWLVSLTVLTCVFRSKEGWLRGILFALMVVLALNFHRALGPPLAATGLGYLLIKKQWRSSIVSLAVGASLYLLSETFFQNVPQAAAEEREVVTSVQAVNEGEALESQKRFGASSFSKALIGLGACVLGGNVVMSSDRIFDILQERVFRYRFLEEERMMAESASGLQLWLWVLGGGAIVVLVAVAAKMVFERRSEFAHSIGSEGCSALLGALCYAIMILVFEPGNPEMWLLGLPFIFLSLVLLVGDFFKEKIWFMAMLLCGTNYLGGISLLRDEKNDYHFVTSELVRKEALEGDVYLVGRINMVHARFVRYHSAARVIQVKDGLASGNLELISHQISHGGRVFAHQSYCKLFENAEEFLEKNGFILLPSSEGQAGYEILLFPQV
ncbi:hypothetical protein [Roseibacillus persicicus]|uniref:hypothetical protein n=1 Tax=Roseibacillus persicicus TaxID=454148 RepID=UPI002810583B|nr:hypothetical protein [Roseibacillus persicicus]MDQ8188871.1 hypothetical protein [Roseibacillus persicicus]